VKSLPALTLLVSLRDGTAFGRPQAEVARE
jgi:hypothetical protein